MAYALFPGCIARNMYPSIEKSTQMVFKELGLELVEVKFTCCPAPGIGRDCRRVSASGSSGSKSGIRTRRSASHSFTDRQDAASLRS